MASIILASASPRREELMKLIPIDFIVQAKEINEIIDSEKSPKWNVMSLSKQKAAVVGEVYDEKWVIGCDTVVVLDEMILGKPLEENKAKSMLMKLSGRVHEVYTGVTLMNKKQDVLDSFVICSQVKMKTLTEEEIDWYVSTKEPLDKAGGYGIQGKGALLVEEIKGDYFNIVGLPVSALYEVLKKYNLIQEKK